MLARSGTLLSAVWEASSVRSRGQPLVDSWPLEVCGRCTPVRRGVDLVFIFDSTCLDYYLVSLYENVEKGGRLGTLC